MDNKRQSYRLRKRFYITWSIPGQKIEGKGLVFNISQTGMQLHTDKLFKPEHGLVLSFACPDFSTFPSRGRLVWFKKIDDDQPYYQCGIKFPTEMCVSESWIKWIEEAIAKLTDAEDSRIAERYLQ